MLRPEGELRSDSSEGEGGVVVHLDSYHGDELVWEAGEGSALWLRRLIVSLQSFRHMLNILTDSWIRHIGLAQCN